jgi:hypothetical protein
MPVLYAMFAYHLEETITAMSETQDSALMSELMRINTRLTQEGKLGPAARLGPTARAVTVREGVAIDGPFAETKEALLGFYVLNCASREEAVRIAQDMQKANPSAVYELRPIPLFVPGAAFPMTEADQSARA